MKPRLPQTAEQQAYAKGYTAGRKIERLRRTITIDALKTQLEYWRDLYQRLKDGVK